VIPLPIEYRTPTSLEELLDLLGKHGESARVLAGGQSLIPALKLGAIDVRLVIDLRRVPGLEGIRAVDDGVWIGALATFRQVERSSLVRARCPLLAEVISRVADCQTRSVGTVLGSVCHADPGADAPAALVALDAEVEVVGPRGGKRVRLSDFLQGPLEPALEPDEIARALRIPDAGIHGYAYARQERSQAGFALAGVAACVRQAEGRITSAALGVTGVGRRAFRVPEIEENLEGQSVQEGSLRAALRGLAAGTEILQDGLASAEYRRYLAEVLATRSLLQAARADFR
jgi:carbon-monoxide dehydrogenase medium subunit